MRIDYYKPKIYHVNVQRIGLDLIDWRFKVHVCSAFGTIELVPKAHFSYFMTFFTIPKWIFSKMPISIYDLAHCIHHLFRFDIKIEVYVERIWTFFQQILNVNEMLLKNGVILYLKSNLHQNFLTLMRFGLILSLNLSIFFLFSTEV